MLFPRQYNPTTVYIMHKGSLQYWHRRRAHRRLPRLRSAPTYMKESGLSNIVAYKVGMTHALVVDDSESPTKNMEVSRPCTVLEVPETEVYGIRLYSKDLNGYKTAATELVSSKVSKKLHTKAKNDESKVEDLKKKLSAFSDATALAVSYPKGLPSGQHHPVRFEVFVGGKSLEEKFNYLAGMLGKELKASDVFKNGEYVDVSSITKGKGWQGPIKRFGVARMQSKATQKVRHVGALGSFGMGKVLYTVPMAGQLGFGYRTEHNKRIIKVGGRGDASINPSSGYINYGAVKNDYLVLMGSIPGPAKRLVRVRKAIDNRNMKGIKEPKIAYIRAS